jgi:hypothetical protein
MRKAIVTLLILVGLFVGWLLGVRAWYHSVRPAGPSLAEHLARRPAPERRRGLAADGQEYLALFGPAQAFPALPSGGPVYIFDRAGELVDWTSDEGDDEAFRRRWPGVSSGRAVSPDEVAAWPGSGR